MDGHYVLDFCLEGDFDDRGWSKINELFSVVIEGSTGWLALVDWTDISSCNWVRMRNNSMVQQHVRAVHVHCVLYPNLFVPSLQGQLIHHIAIYMYRIMMEFNIITGDDACTQLWWKIAYSGTAGGERSELPACNNYIL